MAVVRPFVSFGVPVILTAFSGVAVPQGSFGASSPDFGSFRVIVGNFVLTLLVGGVLLTAAESYFARNGERLRRETGSSFLWGLGVLLFFFGTGSLLGLLFGGVGRLVFVVLLFGFALIAFVGRTLAYLVLFGWLVDGRWIALSLAAVTGSVFLAVPQIAMWVELPMVALGVGAMLRNRWY